MFRSAQPVRKLVSLRLSKRFKSKENSYSKADLEAFVAKDKEGLVLQLSNSEYFVGSAVLPTIATVVSVLYGFRVYQFISRKRQEWKQAEESNLIVQKFKASEIVPFLLTDSAVCATVLVAYLLLGKRVSYARNLLQTRHGKSIPTS